MHKSDTITGRLPAPQDDTTLEERFEVAGRAYAAWVRETDRPMASQISGGMIGALAHRAKCLRDTGAALMLVRAGEEKAPALMAMAAHRRFLRAVARAGEAADRSKMRAAIIGHTGFCLAETAHFTREVGRDRILNFTPHQFHSVVGQIVQKRALDNRDIDARLLRCLPVDDHTFHGAGCQTWQPPRQNAEPTPGHGKNAGQTGDVAKKPLKRRHLELIVY